MIFNLRLDPECADEIIAHVRARTPLVDEIERLVQENSIQDAVPGYLEGEIHLLPYAEIECFYTEGEKTYARTCDKKSYQIRKRLYEMELLLPHNFVRISRSAIANWSRISRMKVQLSGAVDAVYKSGNTECISRRCFAELKRRYDL